MPTSSQMMPSVRPSAVKRIIPPLDPARFGPNAARPVRAKARSLSADVQVEPHAHDWAQLTFSVSGVTRVTAGRSTFIVPPWRAVWIPSGVAHAVSVLEAADIRTAYVHPATLAELLPAGETSWDTAKVLDVSPLLRELLVSLAKLPAPWPGATDAVVSHQTTGQPSSRERHLAALVLDEILQAAPIALGVALPADKRLRALCEAVLDAPAKHERLADWATEVGASPRTVSRLFKTELQTSFVRWRQQVLLSQALSLAARKRPMSHIAAELGYASASAFSAMVTRTVGEPPSKFFAREA